MHGAVCACEREAEPKVLGNTSSGENGVVVNRNRKERPQKDIFGARLVVSCLCKV
jgi:hypothetical protein